MKHLETTNLLDFCDCFFSKNQGFQESTSQPQIGLGKSSFQAITSTSHYPSNYTHYNTIWQAKSAFRAEVRTEGDFALLWAVRSVRIFHITEGLFALSGKVNTLW